MADALEEIIKEVKALRKKLEELEGKGSDTTKVEARIDALEKRLGADPNFGSWD